ncbi:hypothetical protein MNB_ARC-1_173 [hydrothermal vent metagenome]|uniref:Uncharacterized protein n=1 Tax=hydrothermal vent metagenome TaxID=652676 RepID=A0A3B1DRY8_9ZZZZ
MAPIVGSFIILNPSFPPCTAYSASITSAMASVCKNPYNIIYSIDDKSAVYQDDSNIL